MPKRITKNEFETILKVVEGDPVDYDMILLLIIGNHFRRAAHFKEDHWDKELIDKEYNKALKISDLMESMYSYD